MSLHSDNFTIPASTFLDIASHELHTCSHTISGDIVTAARDADVELRTVSGDMAITGRNEAALLKAASVSGDFGADGIAGQVDAATTSGDLSIVAGVLERARLASVSGDIEFEGSFGEFVTHGLQLAVWDKVRDLSYNPPR